MDIITALYCESAVELQIVHSTTTMDKLNYSIRGFNSLVCNMQETNVQLSPKCIHKKGFFH